MIHRLTDIDDELRTATCAECGSVRIHRHGVNYGKVRWVCAVGTRKTKEAWTKQNVRRQALVRQTKADLLSQIGNACEICQTLITDKTLRVDHNHLIHDQHPRKEGNWCKKCFRGILCNGCNVGLGFFEDDPSRLESAARYLRSRNSSG